MRLSERLLPADVRDHLAGLAIDDAGHGFDALGMSADGVREALARTYWFYKHYFRVRSEGIENVPASGPAILAANHSGLVPIDAAMLYCDVVLKTDPPRVPRPIADFFVARLPFFGVGFARTGAASGARANVDRLLAKGELLMIFPEGTPGIGKGVKHRYQLLPFRVGHAELALRRRAPVIPVGIIGAEEQWPQVARLDWLHLFGAPFLPIPMTPFPLPVTMEIRYGAPIWLDRMYDAARSDEPELL